MAGAYLEITLKVEKGNRDAAAEVYRKYRNRFLESAPGAVSKELLVRDEDVQVLHGFEKADQAREYLNSQLFKEEVVPALKPSLAGDPEIRIYSCM